jgi:hypothetical protein
MIGLTPVGGTSDDTPQIQAALNEAKTTGGAVYLGPGTFRLNTQLVIAGSAGTAARVDLVMSKATILKSYVTGSVASYDSAGFAIVIDGWRDSAIRGGRLDYTNGTAGILVRCRAASTMANTFDGLHIFGGATKAIRETATKVSLRFTGNESVAGAATYVNYFNRVVGCHFDIGFTHIDLLNGDSGGGLHQPNAQIITDCLFERYVYGVYVQDSDEHRGDNLWFSQAGTLTASAGGDAGTNSIDIRLDGTYNDFTWTSEPGVGAKAYYVKATANENRLAGVFNSGTAPTIEAGAAGDNLVFDRQRLDGVKRLNHLNHATDGEQDINLFGDGANSQGGAGRSSMRIWEANGTARNLRLGWGTAGKCYAQVPNGAHLDFGGTWENPIMLNGAYLWVTTGKLYIKTSAPTTSTDGTVVGTQT